jgi:hypothetical protein
LSRQAKKNNNNNFQHYNILSAYEVKDETSTSRTYVSLVFYHTVRSRKYLSKKNYRLFFQKEVVLSGFAPKYLWPLGVKQGTSHLLSWIYIYLSKKSQIFGEGVV